MKILIKYILNNIRERKLRTAVMLLSVVLSAALLFVSLAIGDSYGKAQRKMAKGFAGSAAVSVSAKPDTKGNAGWITEEEIPPLASIKNKAGILTASALYRKDGYYESIDLIAAELAALYAINRPRLADGTELKNFTGYRIVLPERFTSQYGMEAGDTVTLTIGGTSYDFTLAAVAAYDTVFLRSTRGSNALIPKETLTEILRAFNGNSRILLEPAAGVSPDELRAELSSILPPDHYTVAKTYDEAQVTAEAKEKSIPCYLISFFSFIMSVFIIYSSYKVITTERLPVIGTFRSIGATERSAAGILLMESLLYGIIGGVLGIPSGYLILRLILDGLGQSLSMGIGIPAVVSPANVVLSCTAAITVSMLGAFLPIRGASRLPVKDVVLGMVEEKSTPNKVILAVGTVLFILSVLLPRLTGDRNEPLLMAAGGFSLLGLIAAAVILIPLLVNGVSRILEGIYGAAFGNEGRLAARNMRGNRNINQNIILLLISLSAVIVIRVVTGFAVSYIGDVFNGAALDGFADGEMSHSFVEEVEGFEGVEEVLPVYVIKGGISADGIPLTRVEAIEDLSRFRHMFNLQLDRNSREMTEDRFHNSRNILINKDSLKKLGLGIGDKISLDYKGRKYEYEISGSFQSRADSSEAVIPASFAEKDFGVKDYGLLAYTAADPGAVMVRLRNLFGERFNWSRTVEEFYEDSLGTVNAFLEPMKKLTYFILLLAAIGVINNLLINYIQKRRSIAMYKSVGLSDRQNVKMNLVEGFTSGLIGVSAGLFVSYMEVKTIFIVAAPRVSMEPEYGAGSFIMAGLAGIMITLAGSVVPILKGSKMKLVEEIKSE